jgi:hypothetical protein
VLIIGPPTGDTDVQHVLCRVSNSGSSYLASEPIRPMIWLMGRLTPSCPWSADHKGRPAAGEVDARTLWDCPDAASAQGTFAEAAEFPQRLMIHRASRCVHFLRWYACIKRRIR